VEVRYRDGLRFRALESSFLFGSDLSEGRNEEHEERKNTATAIGTTDATEYTDTATTMMIERLEKTLTLHATSKDLHAEMQTKLLKLQYRF
jgi:hypothetical protein